MARSGITMADIARAFEAQNKVVDAGGIDVGSNRLRIDPPEISIRWTTYATLQSYRAPESISGSRTLPGLKKATRPRQAT